MIVLGRIVAPHGVKGWVRVHPFGDDPLAWSKMPQWWLSPAAEGLDWAPRKLEAIRFQGSSVVAKLEAADDRNAAELLNGFYVAAPRDQLPVTKETEYYWADLVGLEVLNEQKEHLGCVHSLLETGANAVLIVRDGEDERLLPFVAHVVKQVDLQARCIWVVWQKDW